MLSESALIYKSYMHIIEILLCKKSNRIILCSCNGNIHTKNSYKASTRTPFNGITFATETVL